MTASPRRGLGILICYTRARIPKKLDAAAASGAGQQIVNVNPMASAVLQLDNSEPEGEPKR